MKAKRSHGFTLLEIIVVMAIIAMVSGALMFVTSGLDGERELRKPFNDLRSMAKKAWMRSLQEQRSWQIRILRDRFVLEPRQASQADDRAMFAAADQKMGRGNGVESVQLDPGMSIEVRHWGDNKWLVPRPDFWIFEHSGLLEPMSVRIISEFGTISAQFDPLTASAQNEEFDVVPK